MLVTTTDDSGGGSLRQAVLQVNPDTDNSAADTIEFAIPGDGVHTIQPLTELPAITHPVFINGYSQPGSQPNSLPVGDNAALAIELDGSLQVGGQRGLTIAAGGSVVRGLAINRFAGYGIHLIGDGGAVVEGNFIGTDPTGEMPEGNGLGVNVESSGNGIGTDGDGWTTLPSGI